MNPTWHQHAALAVFLAVFGASAAAQYAWLDEHGVRQYSDRPPPPSVPKLRILKSPGSPQRTADNGSAAPGAPAAEPVEAVKSRQAPTTLAEKNAEFQKRQIEQAEKEKKAAQEAKLAADKAKNCDQAREYRQSLQSGDRIMRRDKSGERSYLTDEQRAQELRDTQRILSECKS